MLFLMLYTETFQSLRRSRCKNAPKITMRTGFTRREMRQSHWAFCPTMAESRLRLLSDEARRASERYRVRQGMRHPKHFWDRLGSNLPFSITERSLVSSRNPLSKEGGRFLLF